MAEDAAVTLAFTDIEGSTTRWERDRAAMSAAVRRHDAILRTAILQHRGRIFKTMGDAFLSVFARPMDAVAAMLAAQQALAAEDFSTIHELRVRAAIHTGSAEERDGDYFGPTVNKVSRLLAIGHGGQVLVTSQVAELVVGALPTGVSLRDLGAYHLKDFAEPQRVFQLQAPWLPSEFPPLRSLGTLPSDMSILDAQQFYSVTSFSGRDEQLAALRAALENDGAIAVVHGLGGIGKSSVAREYGWRNRDAYSVAWWLNAQTEDLIVDGLLRLAAMFTQGLDQLADRRSAAQRVINSVLGGFDKPVFLVFDNLEDERLMRTWLPRTGIRALATSRNAAWSADITTVALDTWSLETAVGYLQRESARTELSVTDARAIAEALGGLPLALSHAAAALRSMPMVTPQRYLERIAAYFKSAPRNAEYSNSVFATFNTAIVQAEHQAAGAAAVLCFAALFAPDGIPDELFRRPIDLCPERLEPVVAGCEALDLRSVLRDELRLDDALGALNRLSLLGFAPATRTYNVHRLVQLAAQDLKGSPTRQWQECAVQTLNSAFPEEVDVATWPQCERVLPHARAALEGLSSDTELVSAASLAIRCGRYVWQRGEYREAESFSMRGLSIREKALGHEHPDVAESLNSVAIACCEQGRYADAEPLHRRALAIREKAFGSDHRDVAQSLYNLANVYHWQGRYAEAEPLYARSATICEKTLGLDHPFVAYSLTALASIHLVQGHYDEAERLHTRALAIRKKALDPDHHEVGDSLNNLAETYRHQGRYAEAEPLSRRALAIWEKALGPDHPYVAQSLSTLTNMYRDQGRYAEAELLATRALAICEKALGPDHLYVAQSLRDLALTYGDQRRYQESEPLLSRALSIREAALGRDHHLTKETRAELETLRSRL
jgi:class 3 adenylate cyclase/tetratricopeptide (TPR) repeat protein